MHLSRRKIDMPALLQETIAVIILMALYAGAMWLSARHNEISDREEGDQ